MTCYSATAHLEARRESSLALLPNITSLRLFDELQVSLVVCGHTHMQFDRMFGTTRVVNAGSVGEPYGAPGAYWLLLGPDVRLRRTPYDLEEAAGRLRATPCLRAHEFAHDVEQPPSVVDTGNLREVGIKEKGSAVAVRRKRGDARAVRGSFANRQYSNARP